MSVLTDRIVLFSPILLFVISTAISRCYLIYQSYDLLPDLSF
uniref:Uncharacterized protein n=1 Tax=Arundo donax TaxID=35708 RepID=A0A0A9DGA1_ARUDO